MSEDRPSENAGMGQSSPSESRWKVFWRWKSPSQLCFICLIPFVLVVTGSVLLGIAWAKALSISSREAILTCGMVLFFSGFIVCVLANFFDACGVCNGRSMDPENDIQNNETLFVDLGEIGSNPLNDLDNEGEKSECEITVLDCPG